MSKHLPTVVKYPLPFINLGINLRAEPGYKLVQSEKLDLSQLDAVPLIAIK